MFILCLIRLLVYYLSFLSAQDFSCCIVNNFILEETIDHPVVTTGMRHVLRQNPDYEVMAEARSPDELVASIIKLRPHVVITDYNMPGSSRYGDGIRLVAYIRNNFPDVRLLVLTMISSPLIASSLYHLGVEGVLLKDCDLEELGAKVTSILRGGSIHDFTP